MNQAKINEWVNSKGDTTLRINYPLNENSVIFDVGGYLGEWTQLMYDKYHCNAYIFEPVKEHYDLLVNKFKDIPKIHVYKLGISDSTKKATINLLEYASSLWTNMNGTRGLEEIDLIDIKEFMTNEKIKFVDVMKINIEGEEYPVLRRILNTGLQYKINNLQIQFHDFVDNYAAMRNEIQNGLAKTHVQTYNVDFIWENWKLVFRPF